MAIIHLSRGLALTVIGFASKAYFLVFIAPNMLEGEFARYFLASSIAVIIGRILSFGARDDLVFRIRKKINWIEYYLRGGGVYYILAGIGLFLGIEEITPHGLLLASISYALVIAGNGFISGALRSYSNVFQEFNANMAWFVVCVVSVFFVVRKAETILYLLVGAHIVIYVVNLAAARALEIGIKFPNTKVIYSQFKRYRSWLPKTLSSVTLAANLRSYPLWLSSLGYILSDGMAYAFILGEVVYQICMVYVHQVHSNLKLQENVMRGDRLLKIGLAMLMVAICAPLPVYLVVMSIGSSSSVELELASLIFASIYCSTLAFFSLLRVCVWRVGKSIGAIKLIVLQFIMYCAMGVLVACMKYDSHLLLIASCVNISVIYLSLGKLLKHRDAW